MSCPDVPIERIYNVNKSCQVIVGNPPIVKGLKSLQLQGTRVIRISQQRSSLVGFQSCRDQYKWRTGVSIYHNNSSTLKCSTQLRKEKTLGLGKKKITVVRISLTVLGFSILVLILSLRKLRGFLFYGFPKEKQCVHCLLCLIAMLVILSVKDPNNARLMLKN